MALIKYGSIVNDIRGSIGNGTFQRGVGGSIVRNKPVPMLRQSQQTADVRTVLPEIVFAWRALSDAQKTNWKNFLTYSPDFMRKSPKTILSAYNLFIKYNTLRLLRGLSILSDITFSQATQLNAVISILSDSTDIYMSVTEPIDPATWYLQMQLSRACSNKYSRVLDYFRIIDHVDSHPESVAFTAGYLKAWGFIPPSGLWISLRYTFFHASMPYIFSPVVRLLQIEDY